MNNNKKDVSELRRERRGTGRGHVFLWRRNKTVFKALTSGHCALAEQRGSWETHVGKIHTKIFDIYYYTLNIIL